MYTSRPYPITTSIWSSVPSGGEDFSTDPQTITIPAGSEDASHCKDLDIIIDDTATERTETFTLTLTVEDHPGVTSSVRVTIRDDDDYNDYSTDYRDLDHYVYNDYSTDYRDHYVAYDGKLVHFYSLIPSLVPRPRSRRRRGP